MLRGKIIMALELMATYTDLFTLRDMSHDYSDVLRFCPYARRDLYSSSHNPHPLSEMITLHPYYDVKSLSDYSNEIQKGLNS